MFELDDGEPNYRITVTKDGMYYHWKVVHGFMEITGVAFTLGGARRKVHRAARRWMQRAEIVYETCLEAT